MEFGLFTLFDFDPQRQSEVPYYQDTLDLLILGEKLGFTSAWVGEEHFYSFGICPSPQLFLSALSQRTDEMRLGTAVSLLPFDHPLRKAEDFAMLDLLSQGRLDLGVGRGAIQKHFQGFGVDPAESKPRYEESIEIIKKAWTTENLSYQGQFWQVDGVTVSPRPIQTPHPPIYRGTVSLEAYEAAGEAGDNAFLTPWLVAPHSEMRRRVDRFREIAQSNGTKPREASVFLLFCGKDHNQTVREAKEISDRYARWITSHAKGRDLVGQDRGVSGPKSSLFNQGEFILSISEHIEERAVVGTPEQCIRRLEEIDDELGLDRVLFYFLPGAWERNAAQASLELFGNEVIPRFT